MQNASTSRRVPGDVAMWFFIMAELLVFSLFFAAYAWHRAGQGALFSQEQQHLSLLSGVVNTVLLLLGSMSVALAAWAAQQPAANFARIRRLLLITLAFGTAFLVLKMHDFAQLQNSGLDLGSNDFWLFYFSMGMFHYLHVVLGMVILALVWWQLRKQRTEDLVQAETAAAYWHMVDLVWLVLFALVYVTR